MKKNHNPIILVIEIWPSIARVILKGIHAIPMRKGPSWHKLENCPFYKIKNNKRPLCYYPKKISEEKNTQQPAISPTEERGRVGEANIIRTESVQFYWAPVTVSRFSASIVLVYRRLS